MSTFEATNSSNNTLAIICIFIALGAIAFVFFYMRKTEAETKRTKIPNKMAPLVSLLAFIVFLIGACTAFFSLLTNVKLGPVTVAEEYIETSQGRVSWGKIDRIYLHEDRQVAPITGKEYGDEIMFLMLVEVDGRTHALSEENYDLDAIGVAIKKIRGKGIK